MAADRQAIVDFFNYVDTDHDGYITVDEIRNACSVDINNDGVIDAFEAEIGAAPWLNALPLEDLNGDHKLSLTELLQSNGLA